MSPVIAGVDPQKVLDALGDLERWSKQCHAASIHLVRSGVLPKGSRVVRGAALGVFGQHSWVVVNTGPGETANAYDKKNRIIDPTLWSYDPRITGVHYDTQSSGRYTPHGAGSIWQYGKPEHHGGETIEFDGWSHSAELFLEMIGPLDLRGWSDLMHSPMEGWPSAEIVGRLSEDPRISPLIPIDIIGNATDLNPEGLYLA